MTDEQQDAQEPLTGQGQAETAGNAPTFDETKPVSEANDPAPGDNLAPGQTTADNHGDILGI